MILIWVALAFGGVVAGAWTQDRWEHSLVARMVALASGCWFAGVWGAVLLLGA